MASLKISQLTSGGAAQAGDLIPIARGGQNYAITANAIALGASLTTNGATSYVVSVIGATATSYISVTPTNAAAALDIAAGNVYVSAKGTNSVTIITGATSGETFDIIVVL